MPTLLAFCDSVVYTNDSVVVLLQGRFKARVTACANNYRRFTLAAALYAGDDSPGRLPSFALPTDSTMLGNFQELYPWLIGLPTLTKMDTLGISPRMWYCPLRGSWASVDASFQAKFGRPLVSAVDLTRYFTVIQGSDNAFVDLNWWAPRPLKGSSLTYPDVSLLTTRLPTPWPSRMTDATISTRPIVSDWMDGGKETFGDGFQSASGAHTFGGSIRSCNSGHADGHADTAAASKIKWELKLNGYDSCVFY
jgi:hypothetical protein